METLNETGCDPQLMQTDYIEFNESNFRLLYERTELQEKLINKQKDRIDSLIFRIESLEYRLLQKEETRSSTHNDNNQQKEKQNTLTPEIKKSTENIQKPQPKPSTPPPPSQPANTQINLKTGFGTINKSIGPRLQQIDPATFQIIKVYEYVGDALMESNNQLKRPSIEKSIVENTIYKNFRWAYVPREKDPNVLHDLPPTKETKVQNTGYIAKMDANRTEILNVYLDRKTAAKENGYESHAALDNPVKNKTVSRNHFYALFRDCEPRLQSAFVDKYCGGDVDNLLLYKDGIGVFSESGAMVCEYACKYDCVNIRKMSDKTLTKCIESNALYNGVYYRKVGSKLKVV